MFFDSTYTVSLKLFLILQDFYITMRNIYGGQATRQPKELIARRIGAKFDLR